MSHVEKEKNVCNICGNQFDTGAIFLHKRLGDIKNPITGMGICPACQKLKDDGYIALVEVSNQPSTRNTLQNHEANCTGTIVHIRQHVFEHIFNVPAPEGGVAFVEPLVVEALKQMMPEEKES